MDGEYSCTENIESYTLENKWFNDSITSAFKYHKCESCGKTYDSKQAWARHMQKHKGEPGVEIPGRFSDVGNNFVLIQRTHFIQFQSARHTHKQSTCGSATFAPIMDHSLTSTATWPSTTRCSRTRSYPARSAARCFGWNVT